MLWSTRLKLLNCLHALKKDSPLHVYKEGFWLNITYTMAVYGASFLMGKYAYNMRKTKSCHVLSYFTVVNPMKLN